MGAVAAGQGSAEPGNDLFGEDPGADDEWLNSFPTIRSLFLCPSRIPLGPLIEPHTIIPS
jgi:hypothetical protein